MSKWIDLGTSSTGIHKKMKTESDGSITIIKEQDLKAMVEEIKQIRSEQHNRGYTKSKDLQSVALVPTLILYDWLQKEGDTSGMVVWDDDRYNDVLNKNLNKPRFRRLPYWWWACSHNLE